MTTKTRIALAAVLTAAAVATVNGTASARGAAAPFGCRTTIAGHTWMLTGHGFSCASAAAVIKPLAMKNAPAGPFYPGLHAGMKCTTTTRPGHKPQFIGCADGKGKNITAFRQ